MFSLRLCLCCFLINSLSKGEIITLRKENHVTCVFANESFNSTVYLDPPTDTEIKQVNKFTLMNDTKKIKMTEENSRQEIDFSSIAKGWKSVTKCLGFITDDERWGELKIHKKQLTITNLKHKIFGFSFCGTGKFNITNVDRISHDSEQKLDENTHPNPEINLNQRIKRSPSCEWNHHNLTVNETEENIVITITDSNEKKLFSKNFPKQIENITLENSSKPSLWKLHKLKFMDTETFNSSFIVKISHTGNLYVSMFVYLKKKSNLNISLTSNNNIDTRLIKGSDNPKKWQKILLNIESETESTLHIIPLFEGDNNTKGYWAVDAINFYPQKIKIYNTSLPENDKQSYICKSFGSVSENSSYKRKDCPLGHVGRNCDIKCKDILSRYYPYCQHHKICDNGSCHCPLGSRGEKCREECQSYDWGINCKSKCPERCSQCNDYTGKCEKCAEGYLLRDQCVKLPVLLEGPILEDITNIFIKIRMRTFRYGENEARPDQFVIQYKEKNEYTFKDYDHYNYPPDFENKSFTINISREQCECTIRILLKVGNQHINKEVPEITIGSLTSKAVTTNSISLKWSESTSTTKQFQPRKYSLEYTCHQKFCNKITSGKEDVNNDSYVLENLFPYSTCDIRLYKSLPSKGEKQLIDIMHETTRRVKSIRFPENVTFSNNTAFINFNNCNIFAQDMTYSFEISCVGKCCKRPDKISDITKKKYNLIETINSGELCHFTEYEIKVTAQLSNETKSKIYSSLRMPPSRPNKVEKLSLVCLDKTTLCIKWQPPYPSTGNIAFYVIQYEDTDKEIADNKTFKGDPKNNIFCNKIERKISKINVQAKNEGVAELGVLSSIEIPSGLVQAPNNLKLQPNLQVGALLSWKHPFLKEFFIEVQGENNYYKSYNSSREARSQNFTQMVQFDNSSSEYIIKISGLDVPSEIAKITANVTIIFLPLSVNPLVQICSKTKCTLSIPKPDNIMNTSNVTLVTKEKSSDTTVWTIPKLDFSQNIYVNLEIGDQNAVSLQNETHVMYLQSDNQIYSLSPKRNDTQHTSALICLIIVIIVTIVCFFYLAFAYKFGKYPFDLKKSTKNRRKSIKSWSEEDILQLSPHYKMNNIKTVRSRPVPPAKKSELEALIEPQKPSKNSDTDPNPLSSVPIKLENYEEYLMIALGDDPYNNELTKQYKKSQTKITKPCTAGSSSQNSNKNRFKNILALDDTRVVLKDDEDRDYINANYVDGYENPKAFIATQAPMKSTLGDFWWMIWQENVTNIIMLTELEENGTTKCEKYWPDHKQKIRYGKILLESVDKRDFSDYVHRQLNVTCDKEVRLIHHLQYTTWPDHGVPLYPQNFTPFVKKLLAMPQKTAPIVVHCNAGCGRTGTLILCDIVLRMAAKEKKLDFVKVLTTMRQQRIGLVNNVNQYVFAHFVVLECLFGVDFSIPIDNSFQDEVFKVLRKTTVKPLLEHLDKVMMQFYKRQVKFTSVMSEEDKVKNRFSDIVPGHSQIYLPISSETPSSYINAIYVDGYRSPKKFIATQQPLPNTVEDFWRLIKEFEVNTIVSLNEIGTSDQSCPEFWASVGDLTKLQILEESDNKAYTIVKLKIVDKVDKSNEKTINLIKMKNWRRETPYPSVPKDLILVYKEMFNTSWKGNSQIIVTCYDGATATGLYLALTYLLEKINYEQVCDVFSAIRTVKQSREQFVQEWGQVEFLYKAAKVYIEDFDNYDNFDN